MMHFLCYSLLQIESVLYKGAYISDEVHARLYGEYLILRTFTVRFTDGTEKY